MALHGHPVDVTFGDCDPVGLVFYPRFFAWFDACFHAWLYARANGHSAICTNLDARGIGLMNADARFLAPVSEGARLVVTLQSAEWQARSVRLNYRCTLDGAAALEGHEVRGLFVMTEDGMRAAPMQPLRDGLGQ